MEEEKRLTNEYVAKLFKEIAAAYEILGESYFKIRAYQNAITIISGYTEQLKDIWAEGKLSQVQGLGSGTLYYLDELFKTGKVKHFEEVKAKMPEGMFSLLEVPGIGPKTAYKLATVLKIKSREELIQAASEGKIATLSGFGEKSQAEILKSATSVRLKKNRILLDVALDIAEKYKLYIESCKDVERCEYLGSLRRRAPTVGDIDFAVSTTNPKSVIDHFCKYKLIDTIEDQGEKKASVILSNGQRVDFMTGKKEQFGALLAHLTGSKLHNIALRKHALSLNCSVSEYGVKKGATEHTFKTEEEMHSFLGLQFITPELREGTNEVEVAAKNQLPTLVKLPDIKGDLQMHTTYSDGVATIIDMAKKAKELGYDYIGITDHSPSLNTNSEEEVLAIIKEQKRVIEEINSSNLYPKVLLGTECSILSSGELGLSDKLLMQYNYAIAAIHSSFTQDRTTLTNRLITAIKNPYINFLAHPTGRLLLSRDPLDIDWNLIFKYCLEYRKVLEINSFPVRLDLPEDLVRKAKDVGIKLVINTDSHSPEHLNYMKFGVYTARRGWCTKEDIVNTNNFSQVAKLLNFRNI